VPDKSVQITASAMQLACLVRVPFQPKQNLSSIVLRSDSIAEARISLWDRDLALDEVVLRTLLNSLNCPRSFSRLDNSTMETPGRDCADPPDT